MPGGARLRYETSSLLRAVPTTVGSGHDLRPVSPVSELALGAWGLANRAATRNEASQFEP